MKLSIITINYNNLEGLRKTFDSVMSQSVRDFEWIVVDGGSTDGSKEFIELHQKQFSFWSSEPDSGIFNAMNKGISHANGDYLNFMNSGDSFCNAAVVANVLPHLGKADILYGECELDDVEQPFTMRYPSNLTLGYFMKGDICHQASFIRRSLLESGYRENLRIVSDWCRFVELFVEGKTFSYLGFPVCRYDVCGVSNTQKELYLEERKMCLKEMLSKNSSIFFAEMIRMQSLIEQFDTYEHHAVDRLISRGHFRKKFLTRFLGIIDFIDKKLGCYY